MPIYEFICKECGARFEELCFSSRDLEVVSCPSCKSKDVSRIFSSFSSRSSVRADISPSCGVTSKSGFS